MEPDVMGTANGAQPQAGVPRCGFCGTDPLPLIPAFTKVGQGQVTIWLCAACRSTISVQLTGVEQPKEPLIFRP